MAAPLTGKGKTVCVTGASGYIGAHVVKQFLERGYTVRGTVRDVSDTEKYGWVSSLAEGTPGTLELFSGDLSTQGSFDEAVKDCEYVVHVAAAVLFNAPDPKKDIVDVSVDGAKNVFDSIIKARAAKRVVLTSSVAAVSGDSHPDDYVFTEKDWYTEVTLGLPYNMGKVLEERLAWKMYEEQKRKGDGWSFDLVVVNPAFVCGQMLHKSHARSSMSLLKNIMAPPLPLTMDFSFALCNVKDVALAHVLCVEKESASGRYIVAQEKSDISALDIAAEVKKVYPECSVPTAVFPTWALYLVAYITPSITKEGIDFMSGTHRLYTSQKAKDELGLELSSPEETIAEGAKSLVEFKVVPDPSAPKQTVFSFLDSFWKPKEAAKQQAMPSSLP